MSSRYIRLRLAWKHEPRLTGDTLTAEQYARLRSRMVRNRVTGCLVWQGATDKDGYGVVVWRGKNYRVHRLFNEAETGQALPDGAEVDHTCKNRRYCELGHHERVTHFENMQRLKPHWREIKDFQLR